MQPMEIEGFKGRTEAPRNLAAFWLLGLLNNSSYVIMLAGANSISSAAVGLVFLCGVIPGLCVKATAPYWFHRVRYSSRVVVAAGLMVGAYTTVALTSRRVAQLSGVLLASLQGALGEASCLALTSHYNSRATITAWSSGTGFAGVFGYGWVAILHVLAGWTFRSTLLTANATVAAWLAVYFVLLERPEGRERQLRQLVSTDEDLVSAAMEAMRDDSTSSEGEEEGTRLLPGPHTTSVPELAESGSSGRDSSKGGRQQRQEQEQEQELGQRLQRERVREQHRALRKGSKAAHMLLGERLRRTAALWPYTVPLLVVYFAEYAMQSGAWAAIGFPVTDAEARHRFYVYGNWMYQAGVFISRSSGLVWQAGRRALWVMPALQVGLLAFFLSDAVWHFWYNWSLLGACFATGLLGGAVYVNAFTLIAAEVEPQMREFSLGAASVADSIGVALADVAGILIQGCLFKVNGLDGADFSCS